MRTTYRPRIEHLESRDCPSLDLNVGVSYGPRKEVTLFGHVGGTGTGYAIINFAGAAVGGAATDSGGNFSVTVQANSLGTVRVAAYAPGQTGLACYDVLLVSSPPAVADLAVRFVGGTTWEITGRVTDEWAEGLAVRLGGVNGLACMLTAGADGCFTTLVTLPEDAQGVITADTTDWWGLNAVQATMPLPSPD